VIAGLLGLIILGFLYDTLKSASMPGRPPRASSGFAGPTGAAGDAILGSRSCRM